MGSHLLLFFSFCFLYSGISAILVEPLDSDMDNYLETSINDIDPIIPLEIEDDLIKPNASSVSNEIDKIPLVTTGEEATEVTFKDPIASVSIDYSRNMILLSFLKSRQKLRQKLMAEEASKRKAFEKNFMRFGKRSKESLPMLMNFQDYEENEAPEDADYAAVERQERSLGRNARGDNFMRFGRSPAADYMRFGRSPKADFMRLGRNPAADFMRFGRTPAKDFMRFGRAAAADFMRFGRAGYDNFIRFGRNPKSDFMRLGRSPKSDFMRLGRNPKSDFMRLGRAASTDFLRFGRSQKMGREEKTIRGENYFRFGRSQSEGNENGHNFMRFGKRSEPLAKETQTTPLLKKDEILETAKVLHKSEEGGDENNPIDKAIKVLYKQHKQDSASKSQEHKSGEELTSLEANNEDNDSSYGYTE